MPKCSLPITMLKQVHGWFTYLIVDISLQRIDYYTYYEIHIPQ